LFLRRRQRRALSCARNLVQVAPVPESIVPQAPAKRAPAVGGQRSLHEFVGEGSLERREYRNVL